MSRLILSFLRRVSTGKNVVHVGLLAQDLGRLWKVMLFVGSELLNNAKSKVRSTGETVSDRAQLEILRSSDCTPEDALEISIIRVDQYLPIHLLYIGREDKCVSSPAEKNGIQILL